jgi:hypothetical protein
MRVGTWTPVAYPAGHSTCRLRLYPGLLARLVLSEDNTYSVCNLLERCWELFVKTRISMHMTSLTHRRR